MTLQTNAAPLLSQANAVGQGFDIYGCLDLSSIKRPLFDFSRADTTSFTLLGKEYSIPRCVTAIEDIRFYEEKKAHSSRESFQNAVAAKAGVQLSVGAFRAEMSASFEAITHTQSASAYAHLSAFSRLASIGLNDEAASYLTEEFVTRIALLPSEVTLENVGQFYDFFDTFGVYYIQQVKIGGSLNFYASISNSANLQTQTIEAMVEAHYKALFVSGSMSAEYKSRQEWQAYSNNSQANLRASGGNPTIISRLTQLDPSAPDTASVEAYSRWLDSIKDHPAIVDFTLSGIWNLCGNKKDVIHRAWDQYFRKVMHPCLTINTSATALYWTKPSMAYPVVQLNTLKEALGPDRDAIAKQNAEAEALGKAYADAGWQIIVLDSAKLTEPGCVLHNQYYRIPLERHWSLSYDQMYVDIVKDLKDREKRLFDSKNVMIAIAFGLDINMSPSQEMYEIMQSCGLGEWGELWAPHQGGSQSAGEVWSTGLAYVLIGRFNSGVGAGYEQYRYAQANPHRPIPLNMSVYFYRQSVTGEYNIGLGD